MLVPPDGYVVLLLAGAILLEWLLPLAIVPPAGWWEPLNILAFGLAVAGLALEVAAARALKNGGASTRPNDNPAALVTDRVFRWSRNPFYCGILLLMTGMMLAFSLDWGLVLMPLLWLALDRLVIPVEERRLEAAFGQTYLDYAARTRRWL